jgi:uncharacterized protein YbjT (DUF2867 family)
VTPAVIGATGHVGSEIVHGLLARGEAVAALVRDTDKARRLEKIAGRIVEYGTAVEEANWSML